jgi:hypothetical protein
VVLCFTFRNPLKDNWTPSFLKGNPFHKQPVIQLTKTCSSPSLSTGGGPMGDFENLLLNQNCKEDLEPSQCCIFGCTPLNPWKSHLETCRVVHTFFPAVFLIPPDAILFTLMNKKVGKCHQATFLSLPITAELTVVGTPHSALAPHAN